MSKVIVVTSGKGGVGKTTTSANIAYGLAEHGNKVVVIDFDVGLRNLDLIMGVERRVVYDIVNVINNEVALSQALIKDKRVDNLFILAASQTKDKEALTIEGVGKIIEELKEHGFTYIICDSPAGIEHGAYSSLYYADDAFIITNPEVSSVRDSDRIIGILQSKSKRAVENKEPVKEYLIITRYDIKRVKKGEMLDAEEIVDLLSIKLLGIVPESKGILTASNSGTPVITNKRDEASIAYHEAIQRYLGKKIPHKFLSNKKGFFSKLIRRQ